jgi:hypothetical protein
MNSNQAIDVAAERVLSIVMGNGGQHGRTEKLASVEVGSADSVYMIAAFCFDLFRRMQYMYKLAQPFADQIPPEIAQEILADHEAMNAEGLDWRGRAEQAEAIMLRLHGELAEQWERNLRRAAGQESA